MNVQECDGMHLKKLLKLLEQGPKAFNMVKCIDGTHIRIAKPI